MRPIDADAIKLPDELYFQPNGRSMYIASDVIEAIALTPTLTLDHLRPKGRWEKIEGTSPGWEQHRCSVCKSEAIFEYTYTDDYDEGIDGEWECIGQIEDGIIEHLTDFCPNCGADMRGGGEDKDFG